MTTAIMERKTVPVRILSTKATDGDDGRPQGVVRALFSVYDVVDYDVDITRKGAFDGLIARVRDGERLPYVFAHNSWDLDGYIGTVVDVEDSDEGPVATAELFLDDPQGAKAFRLLESGAVTQHSYQYEVKGWHTEEVDDRPVRVLDDLDVFELGPCLRGANPDTVVLDAKTAKGVDLPRQLRLAVATITAVLHAPAKAGRVLSAKNEQKLRDALGAITEVLDQLASEDAVGKTVDGAAAKTAAEDQETGKADDTSTEDPDPGKAATPNPEDVKTFDALDAVRLDQSRLEL